MIEVLNGMLRFFEDRCLMMQAIFLADGYPERVTGAIRNWPDLRRDIIRQQFSADKYHVSDEFLTAGFGNSQILPSIPVMLSDWNNSSRRVYRLEPDMQRSLEIMSVNKIAGSDLHFPFPCFCIELTLPIMWKDMTGTVVPLDSIFVTKAGNAIGIIALASKEWVTPVKSPYLHANDKERILACLKDQRYGKLSKVVDVARLKGISRPAGQALVLPCDSGEIMEDINDSIFEMRKNVAGDIQLSHGRLADEMKLLGRIVVGMILHIEYVQQKQAAMPRGKRLGDLLIPEWAKAEQFAPQGVTNGAHVCVMKSPPLHPQELYIHEQFRELGLTEAVRKLSSVCQYRTACWRRSPGKGHVADAPKIVRQASYIYNRRLYEEGVEPSGMTMVMS